MHGDYLDFSVVASECMKWVGISPALRMSGLS